MFRDVIFIARLLKEGTAGDMFCFCFLFIYWSIFNDFCHTNYLKIYQI